MLHCMQIAIHKCTDDVASYPGHVFSLTWPGYGASGDLYTNSMQVYLFVFVYEVYSVYAYSNHIVGS